MSVKPFFLLFLLFMFSCTSNLSETPPDIPEPLSIDVDEDGQVDFVLEYYLGFIFAINGDEQIVGNFNPVGNNLVLHKTDHQNLFLRDVNQIEEFVEEPLFWNDKGWTETIISIQNNNDGLWPSKWQLENEDDHNSYFLGLKFSSNNEVKIGWVELEFDLDGGEATILNKVVI